MLAAYLQRFTTASKQAKGTLYLDLFAGEAKNQSRTTGEEISGSPRVALDTVPPFTKLVFFELPDQAAQLEAELRAAYPTRDFEVVDGDCNDKLGPVLDRLSCERWNWAPTFAMVDQQAAEIRWSTLEQLSKFKAPTKPKVELWLLFAPSMLPRGLRSVNPDAVDRFAERITAMYGTEDWRDGYVARSRGLLSGGELRDELLNLMRWRMAKPLGYRVTHPFEMKNTKGTPLYNMIFATDHDAGERIMNHIYGKAAEERPQMQAEAAAKAQEAKEEKLGTPGLFAPMPRTIKPDDLYVHQPPTPPYRLPADE
jgi:three-Cys-motif partner protein